MDSVPERFSRNLGLLTRAQQLSLQAANVVVCGIGGMGGIAAEALVRMGVGAITIADHDTYAMTDINRQIHCTERTIGQEKINVVGQKLVEINPDLRLATYQGLTPNNVDKIVGDCNLVINGMDDVRASIMLERAARRLRKTIVDAWLTPYASVFVMTPESPHWEEFLDFPTKNMPVESITDDDVIECLRREIKFTLSQFNAFEIVTEGLVEEVIRGSRRITSLFRVAVLR